MLGLHKLFNRKSHPTKITSLPWSAPGGFARRICGKSVTRYSSFTYKFQMLATRNEDLTYDVKLAFNDHDGDRGKVMLRCSIPLRDAMGIIREYDDAETAKRLGSLPTEDHDKYEERFIAPKRARHNIRRVQKRLTLQNPQRH